MRPAWCLLAALVGVLWTRPAGAQGTADLIERGIQAYQDLDLAAAAGLLRRALAPTQRPRPTHDQFVRLLTYLGAAEVFRGHLDSADAVFERLVVLDPRYQIDDLVFPPEVTTRFRSMRRVTRAVAVVTPDTASLLTGRDRLPIQLYGSTVHQVTAEIRTPQGAQRRLLYQGPVGDSLATFWDGFDSTGTPVSSGRYLLVVESRGTSGLVLYQVQVPLDIATQPEDTLPDPGPLPDSLLRPVGASIGPGVRSLAMGLAGALAIATLPALMAPGSDVADSRFAMSGAIGAVGVIGFVRAFQHRTRPRNVTANAELRRSWEARRAEVARQNAAARRRAQMVIHAAPPVIIDPRLP